MKLEEVLLANGCDITAAEFRAKVSQEFEATWGREFSDEGLLIRPKFALKFCDQVRDITLGYDLPDHVILGTLINVRKRPESYSA